MPNDKKDKAQEMDTLGRDVDRLMLQQKNAIEKITGVMDACTFHMPPFTGMISTMPLRSVLP